MQAPMPGTNIEITITRIGLEGDGVGAYGDFHVIVPKTAPGDKVTAEVKYSTKDRIHANLVDIIEAGASRVAAPCQYYDTCGGCGLQHINTDEYKNYKLGLLTSALKNNNIPLPSISWFSVGEASRRRAFVRFDRSLHPSPLPQGEGEGRLGFYEHQSHNVIDIKKCLILEPMLESLLAPLKALSIKLGINIEGWMVTNTDTGIDLALHSDESKIKNESFVFQTLAAFAKDYRHPEQCEGSTKVSGSFTTLRSVQDDNRLARLSWKRGKKFIPVITLTKPALIIGGREIILPEEYFLQASKTGQDAILNSVVPHIDEGAKVLDLFSGVGIYSFAAADKAAKACAYEIAPEMVEAMENNIRANNLGNKLSAYCRDIDVYPLGRDELAKFDTAIINPPRTGALKQTTVLAAAGINKIIMVSCNSSTFARDAKILHENGYILKSLSAIDQFYYSHHLEQVGIFVSSLR